MVVTELIYTWYRIAGDQQFPVLNVSSTLHLGMLSSTNSFRLGKIHARNERKSANLSFASNGDKFKRENHRAITTCKGQGSRVIAKSKLFSIGKKKTEIDGLAMIPAQ